ncbi:unnamed protein product [Zymoseptoria tritici ST99CH_1A5]|uniref:Uncharacterized protein n=1 Tax=Zymoseptoria tritici ST99CH_1A5 TaxID=1276529 RepID=A0A1Y6LCC7_ZYMTR|nr:unnamed protein product [Zymoseptoria tritici ST99CH_3D1]SMY20191.1 unnamed protein product [Zymoseptoria tritici ST99CH_1A5]
MIFSDYYRNNSLPVFHVRVNLKRASLQIQDTARLRQWFESRSTSPLQSIHHPSAFERASPHFATFDASILRSASDTTDIPSTRSDNVDEAFRMGFDTMRSFQHLVRSIVPNTIEAEDMDTRTLRRRDSCVEMTTHRETPTDQSNRTLRSITRNRKPTSLPAPPFQATKSKWSPPPSPGAVALARSSSHSSSLTAEEKNILANDLFAAACSGNIPDIKDAFQRGASVQSSVLVPGLIDSFKPAKGGQLSPLAGAASHGQLEAVKFLLANGADLNPSSKCSASSPLHQACRNNDIELVRYLLSRGADVNINNVYRVTPIMYATKYSSVELVKLLLSYRPDLDALSSFNGAAIHWSVWPGNAEVTDLLLKAGANPNHEMADGTTALHCAVLTDSVDMCKVLVQHGAGPLRQNENGETPLRLATMQGEREAIARLLRAASWIRR